MRPLHTLVGATVMATLSACNMDSSPALEEPTTGMADTGTELVPVEQAIQSA